jgi:hypothetical protein
MRAIPGPRISTEQGIQVLLTEGATGPRDGIQVDCSWEHRGRSSSSAPRLLTRPSLDRGSVENVSMEFIIQRGSHSQP